MTELLRVLSLRDIILLNVVAVIGLRWISRGARVGPPALLLWVLAWICFFLPLAATLISLSRRYPEQGGMYAWVRRAYGPRRLRFAQLAGQGAIRGGFAVGNVL